MFHLSFSIRTDSIINTFINIDVRCIFIAHFDFRTFDFEFQYFKKYSSSSVDFYTGVAYICKENVCQKSGQTVVVNTKYDTFSDRVVLFETPCNF